MLIRIEDKAIGSIEVGTPDDASMGLVISAITQAIAVFAARYHGRDRYDFLSILYDQVKASREGKDGPTYPL